MKKILIITYYWPPSGGSGVQRWLKFTKYLPEFGIEPIVLTVDPEYATFPNNDESLIQEVHDKVQVYRTKAKNPLEFYQKVRRKSAPQSGFSGEQKAGFLDKIFRFIRGNVFIPDARIGWNPYAYEKAKQLITEFQIDTVITTSPPHSTQLVGLRLKNDLHIRWVADLRDPWTEIFYNKELYRTNWAEKQDAKMEKLCLEGANDILVVSNSIANSFKQKYAGISQKIHILPNGYDEKDFENKTRSKSDQKVISYVGNLGPQYPVSGFLVAFAELIKDDPTWRLQFVGNCHVGVLKMVEHLQLAEFVEFVPYVNHDKAIQYMLDATILLLVIPNGSDNKGILTGKLFEYIASGNPILTIGPKDGDASNILNDSNYYLTVNDNERMEMIEFVKQKGLKSIHHESIFGSKYSRRSLTKTLADLIIKSTER